MSGRDWKQGDLREAGPCLLERLREPWGQEEGDCTDLSGDRLVTETRGWSDRMGFHPSYLLSLSLRFPSMKQGSKDTCLPEPMQQL